MRHPFGHRLLLLALLLGRVGGLCLAAESAKDSLLRQFQVDEIEVTARALEKDVIIPQTLRGEELHRINALSVADAIRYFSGVQLKDYGGVGGIKTINVRSMGSNHVGVYYNGVQLGNAQNGQIDLGKYSLDNIEEIQLYNGQKSDIFQSAREFGSAGSVYLSTRRPRFRPGERVHVKAQMRAGSFALANPSVNLDILLTEGMSLSLNTEYIYSDGRYKFRYRRVTPSGEVAYDTTAVRHNGDLNAVRAEAGLNHYYSTTGFWKLQLYNYYSARGIPGAIVNNVWNNGERLWDRNTFVQGSWQDTYFDIWSIKAHIKYANDYTRYINQDVRSLSDESEYLQQELYLSVANKVQIFRWWDVSVAYDFQLNNLSRYIEAMRYSHWLSAAMAFNVRDYLRVQASVLGTFVQEVKPLNAYNNSKNKFTPGIFLSYRPTLLADLRINAFYKQSYRYPTFNDLYYTDMGNALLRPELAKQRSVGLSYRLPFDVAGLSGKESELYLTADYYYNRVKDKIVAYPKGQQFRWTMLNLGDVKINGVDATASLRLSLPMRFVLQSKLQYTYQTAIDVTNPTDSYYGHQIPYIPWHSGSVIAGLSYTAKRGDRYSLNYSFIYVGERYNQQENIRRNYTQPWYTHDLAVSGEWDVPTQSAQPVTLKASLEVNNLLGQDYEVILNYPMPKQNVRCTVSVAY